MSAAIEATVCVDHDVAQDLEAIIRAGLFVDRKRMRRLFNSLVKLGEQVPPGCNIMRAQLRAALARKGWKRMSLSAPSLAALHSSGLTIGVVE
jgi:hypothetical protein